MLATCFPHDVCIVWIWLALSPPPLFPFLGLFQFLSLSGAYQQTVAIRPQKPKRLRCRLVYQLEGSCADQALSLQQCGNPHSSNISAVQVASFFGIANDILFEVCNSSSIRVKRVLLCVVRRSSISAGLFRALSKVAQGQWRGRGTVSDLLVQC